MYCVPRSDAMSLLSPALLYSFDMSRIWNLAQSAPAAWAASISRSASSTSPLWLLPISAITKLGSPAPMRRSPSCKPSVAGRATATIRPCLSSSGSAMMRVVSSPASSAGGVPSAALRQLGFIAAVTGRFRSMSSLSAIQRRKSPSVSTPWRMPDSVTTKISRD